MSCPTCGRRPSERTSISGLSQSFETRCAERVPERCENSLHDLADQAPALLKALDDIAGGKNMHYPDSALDSQAAMSSFMWTASQELARAAILAAKGGE